MSDASAFTACASGSESGFELSWLCDLNHLLLRTSTGLCFQRSQICGTGGVPLREMIHKGIERGGSEGESQGEERAPPPRVPDI